MYNTSQELKFNISGFYPEVHMCTTSILHIFLNPSTIENFCLHLSIVFIVVFLFATTNKGTIKLPISAGRA